METKTCTTCKEKLPIKNFSVYGPNVKYRSGKSRASCRKCLAKKMSDKYQDMTDKEKDEYSRKQREKMLVRNYGITQTEYDKLLKSQGNCCALCGVHDEDSSVKFHVDHCHTTGKVRGILCQTCNQALGLFRDDVSVLKRAIDYLN